MWSDAVISTTEVVSGCGQRRGSGYVNILNMQKSYVFCCIKLLVLFDLTSNAVGWDTDDLELFDLVEEINQNFYDVLGVSPVSTVSV